MEPDLKQMAHQYGQLSQQLREQAQTSQDYGLMQQSRLLEDVAYKLRILSIQARLEGVQVAAGVIQGSTQKLQQELDQTQHSEQWIYRLSNWIQLGEQLIQVLQNPTDLAMTTLTEIFDQL